MNIKLRLAQINDSQTLFEWVNDPVVRAMSFNNQIIQFDEHQDWFQRALSDHNCLIYIAYNEQQDIGQTRFNHIDDNNTQIDISIANQFRGRGLSKTLIQSSCQMLFKNSHINTVQAWIKNTNLHSLKAFMQAGFKYDDKLKIKHQTPCYLLTLTRTMVNHVTH